jgi:hypothetical protein
MYVDQWGEIHPPRPPEKANPLTPDCLAAEGAGDSGTAEHRARLARYGTAKARNREMAGYLCQRATDEPSGPYGRLSTALYECASWLEFHRYTDSGNIKLARVCTCKKHLLCPVCAIRRGGKTLRRYMQRAEVLAGSHDFHMLTLTVKNGPNLGERFRHLRSGFKRLRTRARDGYGPLAHVQGMVWSYEFTRGAGDPRLVTRGANHVIIEREANASWHPHLHAIMAVPKGAAPVAYGKGSALATQWERITGDSFIVHSTPISGDDLVGGFCEVLKYALKFSSLNLADNLHAFETLRGKRLVQAGGCFYGLELPEDDPLTDDPEDGPYEVLFYRYGSTGYAPAQHPHG